MFSHILGNEPIQAYLKRSLAENHLPQTLLFQGPDGVGKKLLAQALGETLLKSKTSSDLHLFAPEGKSGLYAIDTLREIIDTSHASPFGEIGKVFILDDVDRMQPVAANALLKTLEEPTPDSTFILLTSSPGEILPTILSRCTQLRFQPIPEDDIATFLKDRSLPIRFAKLSHGSIGRALELATAPEIDEIRTLLFQVLREKPSFPLLFQSVSKIEELVLAQKQEDPVTTSRRVNHLFTLILMWVRDREAKALNVKDELLFFPEETDHQPVSIDRLEVLIEEAGLALSRNMKLTTVLVEVFLTMQAWSEESKSNRACLNSPA